MMILLSIMILSGRYSKAYLETSACDCSNSSVSMPLTAGQASPQWLGPDASSVPVSDSGGLLIAGLVYLFDCFECNIIIF